MVDFCAELQQQLGIPVIDGVTAAVKWAESLVTLGLSTSKHAESTESELPGLGN